MLKMKSVFILFILLILMSMSVSAITVTRQLPSSVAPGESFEVTYIGSSTQPNAFYVVSDNWEGGCVCNEGYCGSQTHAQLAFFAPPHSITITLIAPQSGECRFLATGYYGGTDNPDTTPTQTYFTQQTVSSGSVSDPCTYSVWTPDPNLVTAGQTFAQTRTVTSGTNCEGALSRSATGTKTTTTDPEPGPEPEDNMMMYLIIIGLVIVGVVVLSNNKKKKK
jgi:hypothetical protein